MGEAALLLQLADGEEAGSILKFLVFDELADQLPARVIVLRVLFGRLLGAGEEGAGLEIHQVGGHDDELGGEVDVEELESVDVIEILLGDPFYRDRLDVEFVLFDEVKEKIEGAFEDL